jgi:hypothetical protein
MSTQLKLTFESVDALQREHQANLAHGRAFLEGHTDLPLFSEVDLVLVHPEDGRELRVRGQIVMVMTSGALVGSAFQFAGGAGEVDAFARGCDASAQVPARLDGGRDPFLEEDSGRPFETCNETDEAAVDEEGALLDAEEASLSNPPGSPRDVNLARERQLRLRNLPPQERLKVARSSVLDDRVLLERIYGTAVWDALLHNPKITVPEVARIARKGTLSKPLIDLICDNELWIRQSIVRRALLANPRLSGDTALRVLRTLSPRELKLVPHQTAYPPAVRQAAQRLIKI